MWATGEADAGTTLIEMLVVMAIVALITAISFPALQRLIAQAAFRESAAVVVAELRVAHAAALHGGVPVSFDIGGDGGRFGINDNLSHTLPDGITLQMADGNEAVFFADGSSSGGAITLSGAQHEMHVQIDDATSGLSGGKR